MRRMIYRTKIHLKRLANGSNITRVRLSVVDLIEVHGGKNGTPNPRNHVVGIFTDKASMKAYKAEVRERFNQ